MRTTLSQTASPKCARLQEGADLLLQSVELHDFSEAVRWLRFLELRFIDHVAWEEEVLLPEFDLATGFSEGKLIYQIRRDHRRFDIAVGRIGKKLGAEDPSCYDDVRKLRDDLRRHNCLVEENVYPLCDRRMLPSVKRELFQQLAQLSAGL